jgi:hypothetical protein
MGPPNRFSLKQNEPIYDSSRGFLLGRFIGVEWEIDKNPFLFSGYGKEFESLINQAYDEDQKRNPDHWPTDKFVHENLPVRL